MDSDEEFLDAGSDIDVDTDQNSSDEDSVESGAPLTTLWTVVENPDHFEFSHNVIEFREKLGAENPLPKDSSPLAYFNYLSVTEDNSLVDILVLETNRYARQVIESAENLPPQSRQKHWRDVTRDEMSAFLGLYLSMGIVKKPTLESYWHQSEGEWLYETPSFSKVMVRDRFELTLQFLHANNNDTSIPRGQRGHDPAHKIRPIMDLLNQRFKTVYHPGRDLTADESMVGFKGRNYIVQYMPGKKTHRWGAKLWILAEADTGFSLHIDLYAGKRNTAENPSQNGIGFDVVKRLTESYIGKHHHVVVDNAFTSPALCRHLFHNDTYITGTVRDTRKGMPKSFKTSKIPKGGRLVRQSGPIMALKYGDRKNVSFLSTMNTPVLENHANSRGTESRVPNTVYMYNKFMGGVDLADQQIQTYDPDIKSLKLWKKILVNLILRIVVNSYIIYVQNMGHRKKITRLKFTETLYQELVGDYIEVRKKTGRPRTDPTPVPMRLTERHFIYQIPDSKRKMCRMCGSKVRTWCPDRFCGVGLCIGECFERFHTRTVIGNEP